MNFKKNIKYLLIIIIFIFLLTTFFNYLNVNNIFNFKLIEGNKKETKEDRDKKSAAHIQMMS